MDAVPPAKTIFRFPIPFDPLRLLLGIREKWRWIVMLPLLFASLGGGIGFLMTPKVYTLRVDLIKVPPPRIVQTSIHGRPFYMEEPQDDTLAALTTTFEILERVGKRLNPPLTAQEVRSHVDADYKDRSDIISVIVESSRSPEYALDMANAMADEIISYTRDMQRREAIEANEQYTTLISEISRRLDEIKEKMLGLSFQNDAADVAYKLKLLITSEQRILEQLEVARIRLGGSEQKLKTFMRALKEQTNLTSVLRQLRNELDLLRAHYTERNPIYRDKLREISLVEQQIELSRGEADVRNLQDFTGTPLGDSLYMRILDLENDRKIGLNEVQALEESLNDTRAQIRIMAEKALVIEEPMAQKTQLLEALALLTSRQKETEFFVANAPGYLDLFQQPAVENALIQSKTLKALLFGLLGGGFGMLIALGIAISWELIQPGLRTRLQACIAAGALPQLTFRCGDQVEQSVFPGASFFQTRPDENYREISGFWLTQLAKHTPPHSSALFAFIGNASNEEQFWSELIHQILGEDANILFVNFDSEREILSEEYEIEPFQDAQQRLAYINAHEYESPHELSAVLDGMLQTHYVFGVFHGTPSSTIFTRLRWFKKYYLVLSPEHNTRRQTRFESSIYRRIMGPSDGLIIIQKFKKRLVPNMVERLEAAIFNWLSTQEQTDI